MERNKQMNVFLRCWIFVLLGSILVGCRIQKTGTQRNIEYNQYIGRTEEYVRSTFGNPFKEDINAAKAFQGILTRPVYDKYYPNRLNTQIKGMYYELDGQYQYFWLEMKHNQWKVVYDVKYPKGVVF